MKRLLHSAGQNKQRLTEVQKIALASVIVFIMASTVFFTGGFLCRHYYGRIIHCHIEKEAETSTAVPPTSEEDLNEESSTHHVREWELKINVAYENVSKV